MCVDCDDYVRSGLGTILTMILLPVLRDILQPATARLRTVDLVKESAALVQRGFEIGLFDVSTLHKPPVSRLTKSCVKCHNLNRERGIGTIIYGFRL